MTFGSKPRILFALLIVGSLGVLYFLFDPASTRWAPKCLFRLLTGWECPGCGSQRMIHALLHGDFGAAWNANPYFICIIPVLLLMGYAAIFREKKPELYAAVNSVPVIIIVGFSLILWGILRNVFL